MFEKMKYMKNILMMLIIALGLICPSVSHALSSDEILRSADQARGNLEGVTWIVTIESTKSGKTNRMRISVKARGFDIATESMEPAKYKGNKLLMLNGNMWFYKSGLSKPVPISQRQKLLGNAVYGDIAATNYADDYIPDRLEDEMIENESCYTFDLKSKNKKGTYDRIVYWISKDRLVGVKAEYYTVSGKKFKSATMKYGNEISIDGKARPFISELVISDELLDNDITILHLDNPAVEPLPDYLFNLNLLSR